MQFSDSRPTRTARENIVPMINVVFLLLIFFLMTAQIAPPEPFKITLPQSRGDTVADGQATLYVDANGTQAFASARGEAVFGLLANLPAGTPLLIRADAAFKASQLASLLARLAATGITDVAIVTVSTPESPL
ncbi:MAG: biopolymer transporter ExbD [Alphaproteobacteria bacterium]|nr:biopolymer transporter ExbD [Alphaproteobacteria bacterium]